MDSRRPCPEINNVIRLQREQVLLQRHTVVDTISTADLFGSHSTTPTLRLGGHGKPVAVREVAGAPEGSGESDGEPVGL